MPEVGDVELKVTKLGDDVDRWRIEVSWDLLIAYWEVGSWCRETVELVAAGGSSDTPVLIRWQSSPWKLVPDGDPPDGQRHRMHRSIPSEVAGSATLDVNPDIDLVEIVRAGALTVVHIDRLRQADSVVARVQVEPVTPTGATAVSSTVDGQFGPS